MSPDFQEAVFRADVAVAKPEIYEALEGGGYRPTDIPTATG
jgi:hypothetical protein